MRLVKKLPLIVALCLAAGSLSAAKKPNIVFIMADDLGWSELGCYGQKKIRTPYIDSLAKQGLRRVVEVGGLYDRGLRQVGVGQHRLHRQSDEAGI